MNSDRTLSMSTVTHIINAPLESIDIADWLFNLPDAEYQRCSPAHIAAGHTTSDDGRPMSINVEKIGEAIMVQHFVAQVIEPHFCRLISTSDAITMKGRTKVHLLWELSVKKIDDNKCEYSNHIHATATDEFLKFIENNGITFEQARAARQQASDAHNREETPNFAKSIERRSLSRKS
jgi:hypothetical protein